MNNYEHTDLSVLVKRCRKNDKKAWRELITRISPLIFSICRTMKLSREESFDVFGQVSYLLLKNMHKLKSPEKILFYVGTITRREVYVLNRKANFIEYLHDTDMIVPALTTYETPEKIYEKSKKSEILMKSVLMLPQRDYLLLKSLFLDGGALNYEDISKLLNMPVSSIGPTRARSLKKLKKILKEQGFEF